MITEEQKQMLESRDVAFATVDENNNPHCIPVGDVRAVSENQVLVGDIHMGQTLRNIRRNKNVSLAFWNKEYGYEFKGAIEYFTEGKWFDLAKEIHEGYPVKGAILVTVSEIRKLA
jgi:predicted pyridoxine 5'-phosphate oxidase superfamily flavin-nucleotide-binding protein